MNMRFILDLEWSWYDARNPEQLRSCPIHLESSMIGWSHPQNSIHSLRCCRCLQKEITSMHHSIQVTLQVTATCVTCVLGHKGEGVRNAMTSNEVPGASLPKKVGPKFKGTVVKRIRKTYILCREKPTLQGGQSNMVNHATSSPLFLRWFELIQTKIGMILSTA